MLDLFPPLLFHNQKKIFTYVLKYMYNMFPLLTFAKTILHSVTSQLLCNTWKLKCKTVKSWVLLIWSISFEINKTIAWSSEKLVGDFLGPVPATGLVKINEWAAEIINILKMSIRQF